MAGALRLARFGSRVLRSVASPVPAGEIGTEATRRLVDAMAATMRRNGVR